MHRLLFFSPMNKILCLHSPRNPMEYISVHTNTCDNNKSHQIRTNPYAERSFRSKMWTLFLSTDAGRSAEFIQHFLYMRSIRNSMFAAKPIKWTLQWNSVSFMSYLIVFLVLQKWSVQQWNQLQPAPLPAPHRVSDGFFWYTVAKPVTQTILLAQFPGSGRTLLPTCFEFVHHFPSELVDNGPIQM